YLSSNCWMMSGSMYCVQLYRYSFLVSSAPVTAENIQDPQKQGSLIVGDNSSSWHFPHRLLLVSPVTVACGSMAVSMPPTGHRVCFPCNGSVRLFMQATAKLR